MTHAPELALTMTRKKVKLAWIESGSARKASLKKRRAGLLKKVAELSTLCGLEACVIIFSPDNNNNIVEQPACWPSHAEVEQVLARFFGLPEMERSKKMTTQETFFNEKIAKMEEQLKKQQKMNKEMEMNQIMYQVSHGRVLRELHLRELNGLDWLMDGKSKEIRQRIQYFKPPPPPLPPVDHQTAGHIGGSGAEGRTSSMESLQWDQWFMDILMNPNENIGSSTGGGNDMMGVGPTLHVSARESRIRDVQTFPDQNIGSSSNVGNEMGQQPSQGNINIGSSSSNVGNDPNEASKSWPYIYFP